MPRKFFMTVFFLFLGTASVMAADYSSLVKALGINKQTKLSDTKIGAGLKEALRVGIDKAVVLAGKKDGYYGNQAIKILMPEKMKAIDPALRKIGFGPKMDEFVLSMNRAAEKAAPAARDVFINALTDMSIEDVQKVYQGPDTAATQYFQSKTRIKLVETYKPLVQKAMKDYGVTAQYQALIGKIPLASKSQALNIENYVVDKALNGLFHTLGEQEKAIRHDPAARVTSLLKEVFGKK